MVKPSGGERSSAAARILVTDAQDRPALAAMRCLRRAGYRVSATAHTRFASGGWSRDCSHITVLPDPSVDVDAFAGSLEDLLRRERHDVLIPGTDEALYVVSLRRERLIPHVAVGLPDHRVVERALSKACLAAEAQRVGLPSPEGRVCDRIEDALAAARSFGFPVLLKGVHTIEQAGAGLVRHPTRLVSDESELREAIGQSGSVIVQRRQTGTLMSFAGVATEHGLLGTVVSRYLRTWPPSAGQASFLETITPPSGLIERVQALVDAIGWRGLFQLQLIEREDGRTMAIDFNPRLYGSMSIAGAAGVPLAALWCAAVLGEEPLPVVARPGIHYRMDDMDVRHILWQLRSGDYRGAAMAMVPRRHTTHAYFQTRDPLPLVARGIELVQVRRRHRATRGA